MKPITRGYSHQIAFFIALLACSILLLQSRSATALYSNIIYSISLTGLYGISALFHCHRWSRQGYLRMKRIDHAAIFALIAGSATPICIIGIKGHIGTHLIITMWTIAIIGMLIAIFWAQAPKWIRALLYVALGWWAISFLPDIKGLLSMTNIQLLIIGGILYTLGALIYAFKAPNPFPTVFGYHEIFHMLVVIASAFHFEVIYNLSTTAHPLLPS